MSEARRCRPAAWLRGKRYCPAQGRTRASFKEAFIAGAWGCLVPPQAHPSALSSRLHKCVSVCRSANLSQSQGSDKNATALRGYTLEWNGGGWEAACGNLRGEGWRDSQHSFKLQPVTNRTLELLRVKLGRVQRVLGDWATDWEKIFTGKLNTLTRPF